MKSFLRIFIFTYISVQFTQDILKLFVFLDDKSFWLLIIAVTLLNAFKRPILELVALPSKGLLFEVISISITILLINILTAILSDFRILSIESPSFNILGFMLPSRYLPAFWAGVLGGMTISLTGDFFHWLCNKKR